MSDVPAYELTYHSRAKKLRLSVNGLGKVKVTAPRHVSKSMVNEFVRNNIDWINEALARQKDPRLDHPNMGLAIPQEILFRASGEKWAVSEVLSSRHFLEEQGACVYLYGEDDAIKRELLRRWLKGRAHDLLVPRLIDHAIKMDVYFKQINIKNQKTRWGSCSSKKNLNFNQNLVFLEPHLLDHLIVHELSHLKHPNHSAAFWECVSQFDPNYQEHDQALGKAVKNIPLWALPD